jgi:hypothetical protein
MKKKDVARRCTWEGRAPPLDIGSRRSHWILEGQAAIDEGTRGSVEEKTTEQGRWAPPL